jgi:hypothetical protein
MIQSAGATALLVLLSSVPTLAEPGPTASPLTVGRQRQLFLDDRVIESTKNLTRRLHRPRRHPANPLLEGARSWEKWLLEVNGRAVLYDPAARRFRMWYGAHLVDESAPTGIRYKVCYAFSEDGIRWRRPRLGQVEWEGSRENNILRWGENWMRRPNVILDPVDPDPDRRFKMTYVDVMDGRTAIAKGYSRDGIEWRLNADGKPWFYRYHSANLLGWDPRIGHYVLYPRMPGAQNSIGRSTSPDFTAWSEPRTVLVPRAEEPNRHFKGLAAFLYEGLYLGWLWVFERGETGWARADAELAYSRDGIRWKRISPGAYFLPRGEPSSWDSEMVLPVAPVVHGDKIRIYYSGWNLPYSMDAMLRAQDGWIEGGRRMQRAIGLATLRRDGFVSLEAAAGGGSLTTRPLAVAAGTLRINAQVEGQLRVEVLEADGRTIPAFSRADCNPIQGDGTDRLVRWQGKPSLETLRGRSVRLRFHLAEGRLYSFRFE